MAIERDEHRGSHECDADADRTFQSTNVGSYFRGLPSPTARRLDHQFDCDSQSAHAHAGYRVHQSDSAQHKSNFRRLCSQSVANASAPFSNELAIHYQWQQNGTNVTGCEQHQLYCLAVMVALVADETP